MLWLKGGPVARMHAISMENLMSEAAALHTGTPVTNVRVLIIWKPFVIQQPRQHPSLTEARSHSRRREEHLLGATMVMAKEVAGITRRRRCQRSHQSRKHTRLHSNHQRRSYQEQHLVGETVMYCKTRSFQERGRNRRYVQQVFWLCSSE